jgi:glucan phosphoethanolaminetransferase (alkaline phosphatase superfamily)
MSNFSSQDEARLKELQEISDNLDNMCKVSWYGCLIIHLVWISFLINILAHTAGDMFNKVVVGIFLSIVPIMTWVLKALSIEPGFEITNMILMITGCAFGFQMIHNVLVNVFEKNSDEIDEILDKYPVEVHLIRDDSNKSKEE